MSDDLTPERAAYREAVADVLFEAVYGDPRGSAPRGPVSLGWAAAVLAVPNPEVEKLRADLAGARAELEAFHEHYALDETVRGELAALRAGVENMRDEWGQEDPASWASVHLDVQSAIRAATYAVKADLSALLGGDA